MNKWLTRAVGTAGLAGGFLLLTAAQAQAADRELLPADDLLPLSGLQDNGGLPLLSDLLGSAKSPTGADLLGPSGSGLFGTGGPLGGSASGLFDDEGPAAGLLGDNGLSGLFGGGQKAAGHHTASPRPAAKPGSRPAHRPASKPASAPASGATSAPASGATSASPSRPTSGPVSAPAAGQASGPVSAPGSGPASAPGSKPASGPASGPVSGPAAGAADAPGAAPIIADAPDDQPSSAVQGLIPNPAAQFLGIDADYMPALIGNTLAAQRPELFGGSGDGGGLLGALTGQSRPSETPAQGLSALPGLNMLSALTGRPTTSRAAERPVASRANGRPTAARPVGERPTRATGVRPAGTRAAGEQPAQAQTAAERPTAVRANTARPFGERPTTTRAAGERPAAGRVADRPVTTTLPGRHRAKPAPVTRPLPAQTAPRGSGAHRAGEAPRRGLSPDPGRGGGRLAGHPANTWSAVTPSDDGAIVVTPDSDQGFGSSPAHRAPQADSPRASQADSPRASQADSPRASQADSPRASHGVPQQTAPVVSPQAESPHPAESPDDSSTRDRPEERPGERPVAGPDPDYPPTKPIPGQAPASADLHGKGL
ncbi:hypothetical protein [Catenuloplanes japonicus]|uniref:hypothetical protein n=1 Tax=Catenuloplanes japonicus TaxID=33876 RepID=UPI0005241B50|nr:hypothetical protein [Catenuloplanes japonicus]